MLRVDSRFSSDKCILNKLEIKLNKNLNQFKNKNIDDSMRKMIRIQTTFLGKQQR